MKKCYFLNVRTLNFLIDIHFNSSVDSFLDSPQLTALDKSVSAQDT